MPVEFGYERFILRCLAASVMMFLFIPHLRTFTQLAVLLFVLGFVWGIYFPCVIPIATSHFAPSVGGTARCEKVNSGIGRVESAKSG